MKEDAYFAIGYYATVFLITELIIALHLVTFVKRKFIPIQEHFIKSSALRHKIETMEKKYQHLGLHLIGPVDDIQIDEDVRMMRNVAFTKMFIFGFSLLIGPLITGKIAEIMYYVATK